MLGAGGGDEGVQKPISALPLSPDKAAGSSAASLILGETDFRAAHKLWRWRSRDSCGRCGPDQTPAR